MSAHLGNKNTCKNIGFWQQPDAEPSVFTVIMARIKSKKTSFYSHNGSDYVFSLVSVAKTRTPSRPRLGNKKT